MKRIITVEVRNIRVEKPEQGSSKGFYSFDYVFTYNRKRKRGKYDSSYSSQSPQSMRDKLKRGVAIEHVIQRYF